MSESRASSAPPIWPPLPVRGSRLVYTTKQQVCDASRPLRLKIDALATRYQHCAGSCRDGETVAVIRYLMDAYELR